MKITIWSIGKTDEKYLVDGISKYIKRIVHYVKIDYQEFKDVKPGQTIDETLKREAEMIEAKLKPEDTLILMDEKGVSYDSVQFSTFIEKLQNQSSKNVIFLIGGAFGHHKIIRERANHLISLSKMTFSHQMVRLFLVEQLYRSYSIIKNEKYTNANPVSPCNTEKAAGVKAIIAAINCDLDFMKLVSGIERYFDNASAVKILHNSTGCRFIKPSGIQLLEPFISLPTTKVAMINTIPTR